MASTFFFYDLETSGFNPREARIMQFAGQRTNMDLQPIGEPYNFFIKMTDDTLPEPDAILITGITPQQTIADGITEAEFLKIFHEEILVPDTIFTGFNNIRFDDEFMRFLQYRNFYDPYTWEWRDGCCRWDMLDVTRMTRALRPEGIKWPVDSKGVATNRLTSLTRINNLDHEKAHDALNDVQATISLARLIKEKQPKLFSYLLSMRNKKKVAVFVNTDEPFVYVSGKYSSEHEKTTVVSSVADHPEQGAVFVYDLRYDPSPYLAMTAEQLAEAMKFNRDPEAIRVPIKLLKFNHCPAVAPLGVLDKSCQFRLKINLQEINHNQQLLQADKQFSSRLLSAVQILEKLQQQRFLEDESDVDARLYEGFFKEEDKTKMSLVRAATPDELAELNVTFHDQRLQALWPLYKARNHPKSLNDEERVAWERFRTRKLTTGGTESRIGRYFGRLGELSEQPGITAEKRYLLEELQLYGQSIMPEEF